MGIIGEFYNYTFDVHPAPTRKPMGLQRLATWITIHYEPMNFSLFVQMNITAERTQFQQRSSAVNRTL